MGKRKIEDERNGKCRRGEGKISFKGTATHET